LIETYLIQGTLLLRPLSLGTVSLSSEDPFTKPVIDPKYLSHSNDLKVSLAGTRLALRIARAQSFSSSLNLRPLDSPIDPSADPVYWPADANPDELTDAELEAYIRERAQSIYHPVGTARMGGKGDVVGTVVGPDLRAHGVGGLRVVDASVFPKQVSGHPVCVDAMRCNEVVY
jgi:choline dehydrogenase